MNLTEGVSMLTYERFYRNIGVRKIKHLVDVKPLNSNEFHYPSYSMVFRYMSNDNTNFISTGSVTLANADKPLVKIISQYRKEGLGKYRTLKADSAKYISKNKKAEKTFKFIKADQTDISLPTSKPLILTYGCLNNNHKYTPHPLNSYYKWHNSLDTMVYHASSAYSGSERHKYIILDLPDVSFSLVDYYKYNKEITRQSLKVFINYKYLTLRELLRYMEPETRSSTIFSKLTDFDIGNTTLLLTHNNKVVTIS